MKIKVEVVVADGDCLCGTLIEPYVDCQFLERVNQRCSLFDCYLGKLQDNGILKCFECHQNSMEALNSH